MLTLAFLACTNSESETLIEGQWEAKLIQENQTDMAHVLPEGIRLDFEYPKYKFEGEQYEQGNYYIKNDKLHLIPVAENEKRVIDILHLSQDSLMLNLMDSLGSRTVLFLRN